MSLDLLLPFSFLFILVIYFIYTRVSFEKDIIRIYDKKFEQWKETTDYNKNQEKPCKELVGLVYKENYILSIELLDNKVLSSLQKNRFNIKEKQ